MTGSILKDTDNTLTLTFGGPGGNGLTYPGELGSQNIVFHSGTIVYGITAGGVLYGKDSGTAITVTLPATGKFNVLRLQTCQHNGRVVISYIELQVDTDSRVYTIGKKRDSGDDQSTHLEATLSVKLIGISSGSYIDSLQFTVYTD